MRAILIKAIINRLNEPIEAHNERMREQNLWHLQKPYHGEDMFMKLVFMSNDQIKEIAKECGI